MGIPKIIHQSWIDEDFTTYSDGSIGVRSQASLKRCYPDFIYKIWSDKEIQLLFEEPILSKYKRTYEKLPRKIMQIDFSRYAFMYLHGGLYFDLDCISCKPVNKRVLKSTDFLGYKAHRSETLFSKEYLNKIRKTNGGNWVLGQAFFGCKSKHPLLLKAMESIKNSLERDPSSFDKEKCDSKIEMNQQVLFQTGPDFLNKLFSEHGAISWKQTYILEDHEFGNNGSGKIGFHCKRHQWDGNKSGIPESDKLTKLIESNKQTINNKTAKYSNKPHRPISASPLIIIASEKRSGSTLLANIVAGLICKDSEIPFTARFSPKSIPLPIIAKYPLIKTHNLDLQSWESRLKALKRNCIFIIPHRGVNNLINNERISIDSNIIFCDYDEFTGQKQSLRRFTAKLLKHLRSKGITPKSKRPVKDSINRITEMNYACKYIEDLPFNYVDVFYQIHGGHRKSWGAKTEEIKLKNSKDIPNKISQFMQIRSHHSAHGQDGLIGDVLFRGKPGFFVDVGARCGLKISNTLYLEKKLLWDGILIEPHPELFLECKANRTSSVYNYAISDIPGKQDFVCYKQEPKGNSGLLKTYRTPTRLSTIKHDIISVQTETLSSSTLR